MQVLSKINDTKLIYRCKCGLIHIVFNNIMIRVHDRDFEQIVKTANLVHRRMNEIGVKMTSQWEGFQLQMGGIEVKFSETDFRVLRKMLITAGKAERTGKIIRKLNEKSASMDKKSSNYAYPQYFC